MAKNQKSLRIVLRQNKNEDSRAYGKWYAELMDRERPELWLSTSPATEVPTPRT